VKTHPRQPPGARAIDAADYPVERSIYALRNVDALRHHAEGAGVVIGQYAAATGCGPTRRATAWRGFSSGG
jgi:hypothetical protein